MTEDKSAISHKWSFFRAGGMCQVELRDGADLAALASLDQKLWFVLAAPTTGLEFPLATLKLLDLDQDQRVRAPEILAAIAWLQGCLSNLDTLFEGVDAVVLNNIIDEGVLRSARHILSSIGKPEADSVTLADVEQMINDISKTKFNGDGVIVPTSTEDAALAQVITDITKVLVGVADRSGAQGVDKGLIDRFFAEAAAYLEWLDRPATDPLLLPEVHGPAAKAATAIAARINDYFSRCRLAAFDARAAEGLNPPTSAYASLSTDLGDDIAQIKAMPLARVLAGQPLPLVEGVNPAWKAEMAAFVTDAVTPILGKDVTELNEESWAQIKARISAYQAWQSAKPADAVAALGADRLRELMALAPQGPLADLIGQDMAVAPEYEQIKTVEKLLLLHRDFLRLLRNFVNFSEFYGKRTSIFQAGSLYLDARTCLLCIEVQDATRHATLAGLAGAYLVYCNLTRPGGQKKTIVAAFTDGDSDDLLIGRNGIFYDIEGKDWDATIVKIVANPISLREAFWLPYKKFVRFVEEQVAKRAAAADAAANEKLQKAATETANLDKAKSDVAPTKKIDVGTVAAMGVAVGAIGGALSMITTGLISLAAWQLPFVLLAVILLISGPSMIIAWLKLRRRSLGPILDANGWAINASARINVPFGAALTQVPQLPPDSTCRYDDPFAERRPPWALYISCFVLIAIAYAALKFYLHLL